MKKMRTIALHIQKGGQGKTTIAGNLGFELSRKGFKVLLVDLDQSQGNLSTWLVKDGVVNFELGDVLMKEALLSEAMLKVRENLFLLPTFGINSKLKTFVSSKLSTPEGSGSFLDLVEELDENFDFDFVIFDLSPAMTSLEKVALLAVDEVVHPITPDFFGMDGLNIFNEEIRSVDALRKRFNKKPIVHKSLILNKVNESIGTHKIIKKEALEKKEYNLFILKQDQKIADSLFENKFLREFLIDKKTGKFIENKSISAFENLAESI